MPHKLSFRLGGLACELDRPKWRSLRPPRNEPVGSSHRAFWQGRGIIEWRELFLGGWSLG